MFGHGLTVQSVEATQGVSNGAPPPVPPPPGPTDDLVTNAGDTLELTPGTKLENG